jgi:hypothetical protein
LPVGYEVVGRAVGFPLGNAVGSADGTAVGTGEGAVEGIDVGVPVGAIRHTVAVASASPSVPPKFQDTSSGYSSSALDIVKTEQPYDKHNACVIFE